MTASLLSITFATLFATSHAAFVAQNTVASTPFLRPASVQPLHLFDASDGFLTASNNFLIATIDQDIAAIPDNEFAPIFAGGIVSPYWCVGK
jgi:hypothetical protein